MQTVWQDVRYARRQLRKSPGSTAVAILTLALGIGANTAIFSVVYGALLSPLPFRNANQLVMVWSQFNGQRNPVSATDYLDWKSQNAVFQDVVAWSGGSYSFSSSGHPEVYQARITSPGFFNMQGIPLFLGRDFLKEEGETGGDHVFILTHKLWQERFGSDLNIIGRQVRLNGEQYTAVGVLAPGMPDRFESQLFVPLAFRPDQINHDQRWLTVMGRLKPGVTLQQANADMSALTARASLTYPLSNKGWSASVEPLKNNFTSRNTINGLWLLMGAVGFVLLIACANVANLLLARGSARQKEVAVRVSLGATRSQLFSQFLSESLLLAIVGGAAGIFLGWALLRLVLGLLPPFSIPTESDISLNLPVLIFTVAATLLAGVLCGCAPAWQGFQAEPLESLKEGGRSGAGHGRRSLRRVLVVLEFSLALTLLSSAGLVMHSFWKLTRGDLGFQRDHVLTFLLPIRSERFSHPEETNAFYRQLLQKIEALPGITSAAVSTGAPIAGANFGTRFSISGQPVSDPSSLPVARFSMVTPDYFRTFGIHMFHGRGFNEQDVLGASRVAVVNETFAKKYLPNVDPLAQQLAVPQLIAGTLRPGPPIEWNIVGVYRDVQNDEIRREPFPEINVPFWQNPWPSARIEVRTGGDPSSMTSSIAAVLRSIDSDLPMDRVATMEQLVDASLAGERFSTVLFAAFACMAMMLAAIGIYGVMAFAVSQRTHEIGLRMALGAGSARVLLMVMNEGMLLALAGLSLGVAATYFVGRSINSILYEVNATDPLVIGGAAAVLLLSAAIASYLPAQRATRIDPLVALRDD
jgi:putative ABC transport system permease protein